LHITQERSWKLIKSSFNYVCPVPGGLSLLMELKTRKYGKI